MAYDGASKLKMSYCEEVVEIRMDGSQGEFDWIRSA